MQVSVIIPTHNRAATLPRAIESVLQQSHPADEILIVDDGSDDDSRALVTQQFPQCRYLHQQNRGVSSARNLGISASKGEWIALLDSDDAWLPQKLEQQLARVEAQEGKRLCHTEEVWIRNGVRVNAMKKHQKQGGRSLATVCRCASSPPHRHCCTAPYSMRWDCSTKHCPPAKTTISG
ncbi:glycosyltransferase family 2 protein [endosymbiont of Riftia pachyptila]|uniref:Glycosyl transferase n=1 Tax=endosymbiont of Riftia pachyptila (vent Ph05) TaxID=1048808 RepID=G2DBF3_9GAMM|nr:glycosyl transferase [endosymbiont of Riftia pachyptila (vent Ph05)]